MGTRENLNDLKSWIISVFDYWSGKKPIFDPLETMGLNVVKRIFMHKQREKMALPLLHRTIFTLILSGIMSGSMTYMVSSFYCSPNVDALIPIWGRAWATAFTVIFLLSPFLHTFTAYVVKQYRK